MANLVYRKGSLPGTNVTTSYKGSPLTNDELDGNFRGIQAELDEKAPINNAVFTGLTTVPNADINGGTIDGTAIGSGTPSTGVFTTVTTTGSVSVGNDSSDTLSIQAGAAVSPGLIFNGDTDTGLWSPAANTIAISAAGSERIRATSTLTTITGDQTTTGDLAVNGGDLTTSSTTFNLLNSTATTVNAFGAGTSVSIGAATGTTTINNANTVVTGDLAVNGGDLTTNQATFNLLNATTTTLNVGAAATAVNIGNATSATLTTRPGTLVGSNTTQNVYNTVATTVNFGGAATAVNIGAATGTTTINNANTVITGDLAVNGGDLTTSQTTFNLLNATATTLNIGGAATLVDIGAATGTTSVNNNLDVDGDVNVKGGDVTTNQATFNLLNATATTVNAFGAATAVSIGAATGTTTINNANTVVTGDLAVNGGDLTTSQTTFNLLNATTTTLNIGGAATAVNIGNATSATLTTRPGTLVGTNTTQNVYDATATTVNAFGAATSVNIGNATSATLTTRPGTLVGANTTQNVYNTVATTVNAFGAATAVSIGAATGTTTINNANTVVTGDLAVNGGDLTTSATTFNLLNATATTLNIGGAGTAVSIGAATGTTTINNANTVVTGDLAVNGGDLTTSATTFNLVNTTATTVNIGGSATLVDIGAATGTTSVNNNLDVDGDVNVKGGDITTNQTTFNLLNTTATTLNIGGASTLVDIGAATGTTSVNNNLDVDGDVNVKGGDITTNQTTFNLLNNNATTINEFGAASSVSTSANAGAASTLTFGPALTGNTFKLAGVSAGTVNYTTDVTSGIVNAWQTVTGTTNIAASGSINLGISSLATTTTTVGGAITGNTLKIAGTASGQVNYTTDVTSGTVNAWQTVTGTTNIASSGDVNLGTSTSAITTAKVGGAITGNILKIASTTGGTANLTTDVTTGTVNAFTSISSGTLNVATGGNSTTNVGGAAATLNVGTTAGNSIVEIRGNATSGNAIIRTNAATANVFNVNSTTVNAFGAGTSIGIGAATGTTNIKHNLDVDLDVNIDGGDLTTSATTFNLLNATATTINFGGDASTINAGSAGSTLNIGTTGGNSIVEIRGNATSGNAIIRTNAATANVFNVNSTTVNAFGAATAVSLGASTGTATINNATTSVKELSVSENATVTKNLTVNGNTTLGDNIAADTVTLTSRIASNVEFSTDAQYDIGGSSGNRPRNLYLAGDASITGGLTVSGTATFLSSTLSIDGKDVVLGNIQIKTGLTGTISGAAGSSGSFTSSLAITVTSASQVPAVGEYLTKTAGTGVLGTNSRVLSVSGTYPNFTLGLFATTAFTNGSVTFDTSGPTDYSADNAGFIVKGTTDKTLKWINSTGAWTSTEHWEVNQGKNIYLNSSYTAGSVFTAKTSFGSYNANQGSGFVVNGATAYATNATASLSTTAKTSVGPTFDISQYRTVEYTVQATQGSAILSSKILAIHDGTNATYTEYAVLETGTFTAKPVYDVTISQIGTSGKYVININAQTSSAAATVYKVTAIATAI